MFDRPAMSDELVNAAVDAAFPGLPEGMDLGEAERRVVRALEAAGKVGPSWAEVEAWLKRHCDEHIPREARWYALNGALDDLREHMHTGTPLDRLVAGPHPEEA